MISKIINKEISEISKILESFKDKKNLSNKQFYKICYACLNALNKKKKIIFYGNGGSASDSQHLATEFTIRYKKKKKTFFSNFSIFR